MTLSKLAQLANVSVSVVSKAFSGRSDISDAMREHVFSVARAHGCFQQFYHARYDKPVIAVIVPEVISKYYIKYIEILKKDIESSGYTMLLSISNFDSQMTSELIRYYTKHGKVDGLILVNGNVDIPRDTDTAIVAIAPVDVSKFEVAVNYSMTDALRKSVELLYSLGHRRIAYIGEALIEEKGKMLLNELSLLGITDCDELFYSSRLRFEAAGTDGVNRFFSDKDNAPTAVFGAYGYITQGIISALGERGYSIPDDVSVISMDNVPAPLSSEIDVAYISYDMERSCAEAISLLKERMGGGAKAAPEIAEISATLYRGESISSARAKN